MPLKVTVESGDDDVFAVLHHECHCDAEIAEELTFVDGDDVVLPGPHQKKFRRFNRFQPLPVVVLHAGSLVVGVVDDQRMPIEVSRFTLRMSSVLLPLYIEPRMSSSDIYFCLYNPIYTGVH